MKAPANRTSKAAMIKEKDRAIVIAARDHFLRDGFAGASMDAIAKSASVSVKTIYSHFANKDELFTKVMISACTDGPVLSKFPSDEELGEQFGWFHDASQRGLMQAGREYLQRLLSKEHLAIYRIVTHDAERFPEVGRQYQEGFAQGRTGVLTAYLKTVAEKKSWNKRDARSDAAFFEAMLRAGFYEEVLHGLSKATAQQIERHARWAAAKTWKFLSTTHS